MTAIRSDLVPQARTLAGIRRYVEQMAVGIASPDDVHRATGMSKRQQSYHRKAAHALGLLDSDGQPTAEGTNLISSPLGSSTETATLIRAISRSPTLAALCPSLLTAAPPAPESLTRTIENQTGLGYSTARTRAEIILGWRRQLVERGLDLGSPGTQLNLPHPKTAPIFAAGMGPTKDRQTEAELFTRNPNFEALLQVLRKNAKDVLVISGAGVSKQSGLPLWSELKNELLETYDGLTRSYTGPEEVRRQLTSRAIQEEDDLWQSFDMLEKELQTRFAPEVARLLTPNNQEPVNAVYERIWRLGAKGIVTFNMDTLAERAFAAVNGSHVHSANQDQTARVARLHRPGVQFVLHVHGHIDHPETWVFTSTKRDSALENPAIKRFFDSAIDTKTLVMVGLNPTDAAWAYRMMRERGANPGSPLKLFVVTSDRSTSFLRRVEGWGAMPVVYDAPSHDHTGLLQLLDAILTEPIAAAPPTVFDGQPISIDELPSDEVLERMEAETVRRYLNAAVAGIVIANRHDEDRQTQHVANLFSAYPRSVHRAWLFDVGHPDLHTVHGHRLKRLLGEGAFGQVFAADDSPEVAVKIMLDRIKREPEYLVSFRRGIQSMQILTRHQVKGMVPIKAAYEVPPTIVMDLVAGPTLENAVKDGWITTVSQRLSVLGQVADIVSTAHRLPEVVLHRDLKPANIMLDNPEWGAPDFNVVVLDFDLSWHTGAGNMSVAHDARTQGYAAPEQVEENSGTTRQAAVDSFGMGMVAFYTLVGRHPHVGEYAARDFDATVRAAVRKYAGNKLKCIPGLLSALVSAATHEDPFRRPSLAEMSAVLTSTRRLYESEQFQLPSPEAVAELAERLYGDYGSLTIDAVGGSAVIERPATHYSLRAGAVGDEAALSIRVVRTKTGVENHSTIQKYSPRRMDTIRKLWRTGVTKHSLKLSSTAGQILMEASIPPGSATARDIEELATVVSDSVRQLSEL